MTETYRDAAFFEAERDAMQPPAPEEKPRMELRVGDERAAPNSTLELTAANANVQLGTGTHFLDRNGRKIPKHIIYEAERDPKQQVPEHYRQPFWFIYEPHETLVVYYEAKMNREWVKDDRGKDQLKVSFDVATGKEELRKLLINWYSAAQVGVSLASFAAMRRFTIKHSRRD